MEFVLQSENKKSRIKVYGRFMRTCHIASALHQLLKKTIFENKIRTTSEPTTFCIGIYTEVPYRKKVFLEPVKIGEVKLTFNSVEKFHTFLNNVGHSGANISPKTPVWKIRETINNFLWYGIAQDYHNVIWGHGTKHRCDRCTFYQPPSS